MARPAYNSCTAAGHAGTVVDLCPAEGICWGGHNTAAVETFPWPVVAGYEDVDVPDRWPPAGELPPGCYLAVASRPPVRVAAESELRRLRSKPT